MIKNFKGKYAFLSNFEPTDIVFNRIVYRSAEAAFQAQKTFDVDERLYIARLSPSEAKKAGRKVNLRKDWELNKVSIMFDVVLAKFSQNEELKTKLLDTGEQGLVEGNDWGDKFWGQVNGEGENYHGKILMSIRFVLRMIDLVKARMTDFETDNDVQKGMWIQNYVSEKLPDDWDEMPYVTCSVCGHREWDIDIITNSEEAPKYCCKCGTRMEG